jgi:hypothetical protein
MVGPRRNPPNSIPDHIPARYVDLGGCDWLPGSGAGSGIWGSEIPEPPWSDRSENLYSSILILYKAACQIWSRTAYGKVVKIKALIWPFCFGGVRPADVNTGHDTDPYRAYRRSLVVNA